MFEKMKKDINKMMEESYEDFIMALVSIEKSIDNKGLLESIYEEFLSTDNMHLLNNRFDSIIDDSIFKHLFFLSKKQREEAERRIKLLDFHPNIQKEFDDGTLNKSEGEGILFWLTDKEKEKIKMWEEETGNLVYHIIESNTEFGRLLSLFYISKHEDEWERDREDLMEKQALVYVINLDYDFNSEYGTIGFKEVNGGLKRIW